MMRSWKVVGALALALAAGMARGQGVSGEKSTNPWYVPRPLLPPQAPSLASFVTPSGDNGLSWTLIYGADGYRVFRSTNGKGYAPIGEVKGQGGATFTDRDPAARGAALYYRVQAYNAAGTADSNTTVVGGDRTGTEVRVHPLRVTPKPKAKARKGAAQRKGNKR